jgi:hypothetical protein
VSVPGKEGAGTGGGKAAYVRAQGQTRRHGCHWLGCAQQVPPAMWGCKKHWFALPATLRARIWATYRPGQEKDFTPSDKYLEAAQAVQDWIAATSRPIPSQPPSTPTP